MSVHFLQGLGRPALQGKMKMRTNALYSFQAGNEVLRDDSGFQTSQADPLYRRNCSDFFNEGNERLSAFRISTGIFIGKILKIQTIRRKVYSREYDFGNALLPQVFYFLKAVLYFPASNSASHIGDNAVRTKLVATVLNLYKGATSVQGLWKKKIFIFSLFLNRRQIVFDSAVIFQHGVPIGSNQLYNFSFAAVPDQNIDSLIFFQFLLFSFHIAACRNHKGIRIPFFGLVNHLSGLSVRNVRYGTGINKVDIRFLMKGHQRCSFFKNCLTHRLRFIWINLAT